MTMKATMKTIGVMVPADWRDRLDEIRKGRRVSISDIGRTAIREFLERNSDPAAGPLSDPSTVGRPTKETETDAE